MSANLEHENEERLTLDELRDVWSALSTTERIEAFSLLTRDAAEDFFLALPSRDMCEMMLALPASERRSWMRLLPPDDAADLVQQAAPALQHGLLDLLDDATRREVTGLLAYREDEAGGLMSPRYVRLRPEMRVDEAISYLRRAARERVETIYYVYVLDGQQRLVGVVSFRELFAAAPDEAVGARDRHTRPDGGARARRRGPHPGHRHRRRHRRRRARRGDRGRPEVRRHGGARCALPEDRLRAHASERRVARRAVPRRDADRHGHGLLRGRDRARGGASTVRANEY